MKTIRKYLVKLKWHISSLAIQILGEFLKDTPIIDKDCHLLQNVVIAKN